MNTAKKINYHLKRQGISAWQRNYYERIIRNEEELNRIRQYIIDNPKNWDEDPENQDPQKSRRGNVLTGT